MNTKHACKVIEMPIRPYQMRHERSIIVRLAEQYSKTIQARWMLLKGVK